MSDTETGGKIIDLMAELKKSLARERQPPTPAGSEGTAYRRPLWLEPSDSDAPNIAEWKGMTEMIQRLTHENAQLRNHVGPATVTRHELTDLIDLVNLCAAEPDDIESLIASARSVIAKLDAARSSTPGEPK